MSIVSTATFSDTLPWIEATFVSRKHSIKMIDSGVKGILVISRIIRTLEYCGGSLAYRHYQRAAAISMFQTLINHNMVQSIVQISCPMNKGPQFNWLSSACRGLPWQHTAFALPQG